MSQFTEVIPSTIASPMINITIPECDGRTHSANIPIAPTFIPQNKSFLEENLPPATPNTNLSGIASKNIKATYAEADRSSNPFSSRIGNMCTIMALVAETRVITPFFCPFFH